tara:strand:+ start:1973 stop:2797 length:825 start_codon:yes stop_codon:yes gene_type:complete
MYYVLTGTNGLIGGQLKKTVEEKFSVVQLNKSFLDDNISNLKSFEASLKFRLDELVRDSLGVYHNGAMADTSDFSADVMYYNYYFTKLLVDSCYRSRKPLVFASTQMVVGREGLGYPENIYGWSKVACEDYGMLKSKDVFKFIALRYTNVYGPGEEHKGKTSSLAYQAFRDKKISLWNAQRDFVYVNDVVSANIHAMNQVSESGIYWVGSGKSEKAYDFIRGMGDDIDISIRKDDPPAWFQWKTWANPDWFMSGWEPEYGITEGTSDYVKYLRG